ncbi:hypothetical protein BJJ97_19635 [Pectobacterium polaris]|nr:hypothetical protein BJJ97_19635 [Pectobacterium polaris]
MARPDWGALQDKFLAEHAKTGISAKDWCVAKGLNYASAKLHIKVTNYGANSQKSGAPPVKAKKAAKEKHESPKAENPPETKPIRGSRTAPPVNPFQPGNQHALKHGGYALRAAASRMFTNVGVQAFLKSVQGEAINDAIMTPGTWRNSR